MEYYSVLIISETRAPEGEVRRVVDSIIMLWRVIESPVCPSLPSYRTRYVSVCTPYSVVVRCSSRRTPSSITAKPAQTNALSNQFPGPPSSVILATMTTTGGVTWIGSGTDQPGPTWQGKGKWEWRRARGPLKFDPSAQLPVCSGGRQRDIWFPCKIP